MGSPNIADNDIKNIPVYGIVYDMFNILESDNQFAELYLDNVGFTRQEIMDMTGIDIYKLDYDTILALDDFADEIGIDSITDYTMEIISDYYNDDVANIEQYLDDLNSNLELLNVDIVNGYHEGIFLVTNSDYVYDGNEPDYEAIMEDFELNTVEEAKSMFDSEVNKVNSWLKSTAKNNGWNPYAGGYTGGFYNL